MDILTADTRTDLARFIRFPYQLYRDDPQWFPPLRSEQWAQFNPKLNPMLNHCETQLFLLKDGRKVLGRCSAFIDRIALDHWGEPIGLFGAFECVDDEAGAHLLLGAARD